MTYVLVIVECLHLWDRSEGFQLQPQQADVVHWRWTAAIARDWAYQLLHHGRCPFCGADLIWKSGAPLRVKIFLWLACRRRIWTADRRRWRGLDAHDACWLCDQQPETADHLLVVCPCQGRGIPDSPDLGYVARSRRPSSPVGVMPP
jgi:hypothetical protein